MVFFSGNLEFISFIPGIYFTDTVLILKKKVMVILMPIATTHPLGLLLANKKVNIVNVSVHTMNAHGEQ